MTVSRACLAFCCLLLISLTTTATAAGTVRHQLSFAEARSQYVHVESVFPSEGEFTELVMASWTPGSYLIREFDANLDRIRITDAAGRSLSFSKISKNRWRVESAGAESVVAEYDVHAGNLGVNTSWVSEQFVLINGASVFLHTASSRDLPHLLSVEPGDNSLTPYTPLSVVDGVYQARNFDHLVDSPLVIANASVSEFRSAGSTHMLVNIGDSSLWDTGLDPAVWRPPP